MIKFFRRLRRSLLAENKVNKYLLYAIGEIVLVVIGILIALGINNWNESRKNRILEFNYIDELIIDLEKDAASIKDFVSQSNDQVRAKYRLNKFLTEQTNLSFNTLDTVNYPDFIKTITYDKDSLVFYYRMQWRPRYNFIPITTTIDEMKSTGKIGIVANQELRRAIIETYNYYESFISTFQEGYNNNQKEIMKIMLDEIPDLYRINNANLVTLFEDTRVLNRFEANYVMTLNRQLLNLEQVNKKLLDALNEYAKEK